MEKIRIVGIGGSLSNYSTSLEALKLALNGAQNLGAEIRLFDVNELNLPMYHKRFDELPTDAVELCRAVSEADGLIWSSPLYHGTISGSFKNALDWLELLSDYTPKYLTGKVVGLISTAGGVQGLQAINTMEYVVRALRGVTLPMVIPVSRAWQVFDKETGIKDSAIEKHLLTLGKELYLAARQFSKQTVDSYEL